MESKLYLRRMPVTNDFWEEIIISTYPGGEVILGNISPYSREFQGELNIFSHMQIKAYLMDSTGIMALAMLNDALIRRGVEQVHLLLPYFPYARQDRAKVMVPGNESLGAAVMAGMLNNMNFASITVDDPHSDVTPALLHRAVVRGRVQLMKILRYTGFPHSWNNSKTDVSILCPDAGALKASYDIAQAFDWPEVVLAGKHRNMKTGKIVGTFIHDGELLEDKNVIICDDLCDGGRTFIELAKTLRENQIKPRTLTLYVTHGIFSQGMKPLLEEFDCVMAFHNYPHFHEMRDTEENYAHLCIYRNDRISFEKQGNFK